MTALQNQKQAEWYCTLLERAVEEADNLPEAILAADLAMSIQPWPDETPRFTDAELGISLANDLFNKRAQGILNKAMQAMRGIAKEVKQAIREALKLENPSEAAQAIIGIINTHRISLTNLLGATQLAAVLEGALEVARKVPAVPFPGTSSLPPPTLPPDEALKLIERLRGMAGREAHIVSLPTDQQDYVRQVLNQQVAFLPAEIPVSAGVHFPIIEEAVRELASKNVMDRATYDQLDAATRQKAFTVANVSAHETLTKIRDVLAQNVAEGADYRAFREKMLEDIGQDTFLSEPHMEVVFRNAVNGAFSDGQMKVLQQPFIRNGFPFAAVHAIHDDRVREEHLEVEKIGLQETNIFLIDDPVFQTFRGPWDFGCRCGWTPMTVRQAAEKGILHAQEWLKTGSEPFPRPYVAMPSFRPPAGFQRALSLSLEPLDVFFGINLAWLPTKTNNAAGLPGWRNEQSGEIRYQLTAPGSKPPAAPIAPVQKPPTNPSVPTPKPAQAKSVTTIKPTGTTEMAKPAENDFTDEELQAMIDGGGGSKPQKIDDADALIKSALEDEGAPSSIPTGAASPVSSYQPDLSGTGANPKQTPEELSVRESYKEWQSKLTPDQKKAIREYTDSSTDINDTMRGKWNPLGLKADKAKIASQISHIREAIASSPGLPKAAILRRGLIQSDFSRGLKQGQRFRDKAFVSSTFDKETADNFALSEMVEIEAPTGTKGAYIGGAESEFLLGENHTMEVISISEHPPSKPGGRPRRLIKARIVQ